MITTTKPPATPPMIPPAVLTLMVFAPDPLEDVAVTAATPEEDDPVGFCEVEVYTRKKSSQKILGLVPFMFVITISWSPSGDRSSFEKKVTFRTEGPDGVNGAV